MNNLLLPMMDLKGIFMEKPSGLEYIEILNDKDSVAHTTEFLNQKRMEVYMYKIIFVLVGLLMLLTAEGAHGDGWTHMTDIPNSFPYSTFRYSTGCAARYPDAATNGDTSSFIHMFGGNYDDYLSLGVCDIHYRYNPSADTIGGNPWEQKANLPYSAYDLACCPAIRNDTLRIYTFCGSDPMMGGLFNYCYEYTPETDTWIWRRSMGTAREGLMQAAEVNNKIYVIGGAFLTLNQQYDPVANTVTGGTPEPAPRADQAVVAANNTVYCIGGASGMMSYHNNVYLFSPPAPGSWGAGDLRSYGSSGSVGAYYRDIIYVFSGGNLSTYLNTVGRYSVSADNWILNGPPMLQIQDGAVCGTVTKFYRPTPFNLLTPTNGATVASLKPTLDWEASDRTKGPRIWVISGGIDAWGPTGYNEAYTITSDTTSANDTLLYTLYYSLEAIVDAPVDSIVDLTTNSYSFTSDLVADTVYYWKVKRTDYYEETERWSNQLDWWFRTPSEVAIELSSFSAWFYQGDIKVIWRTESEKDNIMWLIERAYEKADNYTLIGTVDGQGNKPTPTDYTFTDKGVSKEGRYFYRLGAINSQGETEWNGPVSVIFRVREAGSSILSVLPSANRNIKINYIVEDPSHTTIELYNLTGRRIATLLDGRKEKGKFSLTWNGRMSNGSYAPRGVYFCRMQSGSLSRVVKFVYMK